MLMRHVLRCLIGGAVALLPIGGTILGIVWVEWTLADAWIGDQVFYFPGLGIVAALLALYVVGFFVTTFVGKWIWGLVDGLIDRLPGLGSLYRTFKQILGYGEGKDAIFQKVVLLPSVDTGGEQIGLLTQVVGEGEGEQWVVFVPGSPNPATGRLIMVRPEQARVADQKVADALKVLFSVGKADWPEPSRPSSPR